MKRPRWFIESQARGEQTISSIYVSGTPIVGQSPIQAFPTLRIEAPESLVDHDERCRVQLLSMKALAGKLSNTRNDTLIPHSFFQPPRVEAKGVRTCFCRKGQQTEVRSHISAALPHGGNVKE